MEHKHRDALLIRIEAIRKDMAGINPKLALYGKLAKELKELEARLNA